MCFILFSWSVSSRITRAPALPAGYVIREDTDQEKGIKLWFDSYGVFTRPRDTISVSFKKLTPHEHYSISITTSRPTGCATQVSTYPAFNSDSERPSSSSNLTFPEMHLPKQAVHMPA